MKRREGSLLRGNKKSLLDPPVADKFVLAMDSSFLAPVSDDEIRRERQKARELRSSQWWKRKRAKGMCQYCGGKFPPRELTMDHLVPIVRGGKSTKGNVVPSCKVCNTKKKHSLLMEWEEYTKG